MIGNALITGFLLFILGPIFFFMGTPGHQHATAFIASLFGIFIGAFALAAKNPARTKAAMHGAAMFGVLGILGSLMSVPTWPAILRGQPTPRPLASWEMLIMFIICVIFVASCVRWFMSNRRARTAAE